jgi:hypothetical protein
VDDLVISDMAQFQGFFFFVNGYEQPECVKGGKYFDTFSYCLFVLEGCNYLVLTGILGNV